METTMQLKTQLRYTAVLVAAALSMGAANAATVNITNAGFEDGFDGWEDKNSAAISSDEYTGSKAAKITSSGGRFEQDVEVIANTDYELSAYIEGDGKIGVTIDGERTRLTGGGDDEYEKVTVSFNSGSETTITIWGEYNDGTARFDDFTLTSEDPVEETTPVEETDPVEETAPVEETEPSETIGTEITISTAYDDDLGHVNFPPSNVIDGDTDWTSRWAAEATNGSTNLMLQLAEDTDLTEVGIAWGGGELRAYTFEIWTLASTSDTWTRVYEGISTGITTDMEFYDIDDISAQVIRIKTLENTAGTDWTDITEVKAYAQVESVSDPVVEEPIVEEPIVEEPIIEEPILEPGTATYPSDLFNYEQWKITYPDGEEVKDLYQEENEYYYVNEEKNGIVFYAPVRSDNGTTKNSSYIRSELRERTEDGSSDIYWTTDGTHVAYVKQAITHLPMVKPHLVATQIHGNKDDGIDDAMVLRLEEEHLFLSFNGGKLHDDVTVKTDYTLGTVHEVIFEVIDGKHYVYYSEDGALNAAYTAGNAEQYLVKDGSNDYVMDLDYDQSYFKVGNYTQSNADKEGDYTDHEDNYGEVEVYDFWVNHED